MIISGSNISKIIQLYGVEKAKAGTGAKASGNISSQRSDAIILSSEAQGLQQKIATIKALPDVRQDRVNELTLKVESGQYKVDAAKVADQMIGRILADKLK